MSEVLHERLGLMPPDTLQQELWRRGELRYLLFPGGQTTIYNFIHDWKRDNRDFMGPLVVEAHRGLGKSFLLLLFAFEYALRHPRSTVRYGGPSLKDCLQITQHNRAKLIRMSPEGMIEDHPEHIIIRNPRWEADGKRNACSEIYFFGCNRECIDSQRGLRANLIILDEVGYIDDPQYVVKDVMAFHTVLQEDPLMLLSSTPPKSQGHLWCTSIVPEAKGTGRYVIQRTIDNPDFRADDEARLISIVGKKESTSWRREALCEHVSDETEMVVPEFLHRKDAIIASPPKPSHCYQITGADFGFKDATAVLFAYVDFRSQKVVFEDEIVQHYLTTRKLADLVKAKEETLFHYLDPLKTHERPLWNQVRRVADATPQQLEDLSVDHKVFFETAEKHDRDAQIADFRSAIDSEKILIHPRCQVLIHQLGAGIWNKSRRDFDRQIGEPEHGLLLGHLDAIAAAIYTWHFAKRYLTYNPFPAGTYDPYNQVITSLPKPPSAVEITHFPLTLRRARFN